MFTEEEKVLLEYLANKEIIRIKDDEYFWCDDSDKESIIEKLELYASLLEKVRKM